MTVDEMRAITRYIEQNLDGVTSAYFQVEREVVRLEIKMKDGRIFYDALNLENAPKDLADEVLGGWSDGVHRFVREQAAKERTRAAGYIQ